MLSCNCLFYVVHVVSFFNCQCILCVGLCNQQGFALTYLKLPSFKDMKQICKPVSRMNPASFWITWNTLYSLLPLHSRLWLTHSTHLWNEKYSLKLQGIRYVWKGKETSGVKWVLWLISWLWRWHSGSPGEVLSYLCHPYTCPGMMNFVWHLVIGTSKHDCGTLKHVNVPMTNFHSSWMPCSFCVDYPQCSFRLCKRRRNALCTLLVHKHAHTQPHMLNTNETCIMPVSKDVACICIYATYVYVQPHMYVHICVHDCIIIAHFTLIVYEFVYQHSQT